MRSSSLIGVALLIFSCQRSAGGSGRAQQLAPLVAQPGQPTATTTSVQSQPTPPGLSIENFKRIAPLHSWDAENIIRINGIALSPDTEVVALIIQRYKEQWWLQLRDADTGNLSWEIRLREKAAYNALAFSPQGDLIAVGLDHGDIEVRKSSDSSLVQTLTGHEFAVRIVFFSPDGTLIASGASDNTARVWQVSNAMARAKYKIKTDARDIAFSPDGQYLAVSTNYVDVFHVPSPADKGNVFYDQVGDTKDMGEVAFSPNGVFLVGAGPWLNPENHRWRYRIFLWDFPHNRAAPMRIPLDDAIEDVIISPDGQVLLGVYKDKGKLLLINILTREIRGTIDLGPKLYMSYSPDISKFAVVSTDTTVTMWGIPPEQ